MIIRIVEPEKVTSITIAHPLYPFAVLFAMGFLWTDFLMGMMLPPCEANQKVLPFGVRKS